MSLNFLDVWLSPTRLARLLSCPASAVVDRVASEPRKSETNAGTLAHQSLRAWIESGAWLAPNPSELLVAAFDQAAAQADVDLGRLRDGRVARARLAARALQITELLRLAASVRDIKCEIEMRDDRTRLFGFVDVTITSAPGAVLDLKSGRDGSAQLPLHIVHQLMIYAHLFSVQFGFLPRQVAAFTLAHGLVRVEASEEAIAELLQTIERARLSSPELALPDPEACRYCARRFVCSPHWGAVAEERVVDAVEGRLVQDESAANGKRALRLASGTRDVWITQIPGQLLPSSIPHGAWIRAVRVWAEDPAGDAVATWRAGSQSAINISAVALGLEPDTA